MEAQGKKIEAEALKLCAQLPALLADQQALAASLPEFKPYARMTQADVDDCGKDDKHDGVAATTHKHQVRDEIRQKIREGIRLSSQATTAETKDAEPATPR